MLSYVAFFLLLTHGVLAGVDGQTVPHIHHGVEKADIWGDVWVVNLRSGIDPQVRQTIQICVNILSVWLRLLLVSWVMSVLVS